MNLALSEILGQDLRFAKRITQSGVIILELRSNEVQIQICLKSNSKLAKIMFKLFNWIEGIITNK